MGTSRDVMLKPSPSGPLGKKTQKDGRFNGGIWFDLKAEVSKNVFGSNRHGSHGSDVRHGNNGGERVRFRTRSRTRHMYLGNYITCSLGITADRKQGADNWHM